MGNLIESIKCVECKRTNLDIYLCITEGDLCLGCCECPEHDLYTGSYEEA